MAAVGCEQIYEIDMNDEALIKSILDILEKHYHGRNWIDRRCAEELAELFKNQMCAK